MIHKRGQQQFLRPLFAIFVLVVILLALFFEGKGIDFVSNVFVKIFISLIFSIVAGAIVGLIPVGLLNIGNITVYGFRFNLIAAVLTFIIKTKISS